MTNGSSLSRMIRIRVKKEDSAFVYFILESNEGVMGYSTLDYEVGDPFRDLELTIPLGLQEEAEEILQQLGELIYDLDRSK